MITNIAKRYNLQDPNEGAIWQPGVLQKQIDAPAESAGQLADNLNRINKNLEKQKRKKKIRMVCFSWCARRFKPSQVIVWL